MKYALFMVFAFLVISSVLTMPNSANSSFCDDNTVEGNCVRYARSQVPQLPVTDLTFYGAKVNIINHRFPRVGDVAVMPTTGSTSAYGHVAIVRNIAVRTNDGSLNITLQESNWDACAINTHIVTPESRNIEGYFEPAFPSGQASPKLDNLTNSAGSVGTQFYVTASGSNFDASNMQGIILGGWCDSFGKCTIPNNVMTNRSSTNLSIPVTLNAAGTYRLYLYNPVTGKTSNGKPITIN